MYVILIYLIVNVLSLQNTWKNKKCVIFNYQNRVNKEKQVKVDLPRNYAAAQYFKQLPYLSDTNNPTFQNSVINTLNNRVDL